MNENKEVSVEGRTIYNLVLEFLLQFRLASVSDDDANHLLRTIEKSRLDLSPQLYKSLIDFYSSFLQILPSYCAWFRYTSETRKEICSTYGKTRKSFFDFVSNGPANFLFSVSEEQISRFICAFRNQYDCSIRIMTKNPELSGWLSVTDKISQCGADWLYAIVMNGKKGE